MVLAGKGWRAGTWGGEGVAMRVTDPSRAEGQQASRLSAFPAHSQPFPTWSLTRSEGSRFFYLSLPPEIPALLGYPPISEGGTRSLIDFPFHHAIPLSSTHLGV